MQVLGYGPTATGVSFVPMGSAATEGVPAGETGMASELLNSSRQVGLAVLVGVSVGGFAAEYWAAAGVLGAGAVVAGLLYRRTGVLVVPAGKNSPGFSGEPVDVGESCST
ncbi:hypothetical protein ACSCBZ_01505 [Streptomyces niveiscabiei]|uniref:hypothetical protein n=1 Tax=Streptomyces niveiscabiei TaxID=164115 RepID=UPI003EBF9DB5